MSFLSKLFGGGGGKEPAKAEAVEHAGFRIYPDPVKEQGGYRVAARIEKDVEGETKSHDMIRADTYASPDTASDASVSKAKQFIDQMGDRIFDPR
ncbi:MAG: HlyU family transcriptional regulator [Paracoccaceae bacterium]